jgi:hypothetical protein
VEYKTQSLLAYWSHYVHLPQEQKGGRPTIKLL